jgi:hypothetical protein
VSTTEGQRLTQLYRARRSAELVDVPELAFLMIDGHGNPNASDTYRAALQALYSVSYALTFAVKHAGGPTHRVGPPEGLWSVADMAGFETADKAEWDWTMMIRQPDEVTPALVARAAVGVAESAHLPEARDLRLERFAEGRAAQVLHLGSYADERPTIEALHGFIAAQGYASRGRHHEIYLGDPRRSAPERLKTIIRQPVCPA